MQTPTVLNNRYRVIRVLASGGFGETFLAEDTQMPSGRRCLIKKLKPVANNPQIYQLVQERFQREAAILEELGDGCSQIPKLYAYFLENDEFFLVQEYIESETLQQKLQQQGVLSESSVKEIIRSILIILDYVHSKRIVHRDIKPENILIRHADGKPVLIDFGAVKETMGTLMSASGNSSRSIVIGTPGFMPSEQSAGRPVFASDLYSLGLTAIYLLTSKLPQQLETDPATGDLLWRQYALNVSPSFATFLDKAIAFHPDARYSSAKEMLDSLQHRTTPIPPTIPVANPTLFSPRPDAYPQQQQQTVLAAPPAIPYQQLGYSQPPLKPSQEMGDWQKAVIIGSVIGTFVVGGLWLIRGELANKKEPTPTVTASTPSTGNLANSSNQQTSDPVESNSPINNVPNPQQLTTTKPDRILPSPTPTFSTEPPDNPNSFISSINSANIEPKITKEAATELIGKWLYAKRVMFAPPYDFQAAYELTTGELYAKTAGVDGSISSLKNDGHQYRYDLQRIDSVDEFQTNGSQATITVKVTENRKLFDQKGNILPSQTDFKTRIVRYNLQFVERKWKIESSQNFTD
ncbi:MAG: IMS domain-containing protein [Nostoc sp.]|uniref:protein kinase domain-containing protein n=1 Tax=Nostoc sp. TaxID=1180 RepID=UPI002FF881A8